MSKISVIVPVYKAEDYLGPCVESILAQTYQDLEVILVDDGSPDRSGAICDEYAARDSRVKVVHKENGGVSMARNAGLDAATGEWVTFVDSDDLIDCRCAEHMMKTGARTGADLICCGFNRFSEESELQDKNRLAEYPVELFSREEAMGNAFAIGYLPNVWGKLVRAELLRDLRFPNAKRAEDLWISYRLLGGCEKVAMIRNYQPYHYRKTPQSAMSKLTARHIEDDMKMRLDSFLTLFVGHYPATERSLARQTRGIYLDFALSVRNSRDKNCQGALRRWAKTLCRRMWKPTAVGLGEKLDYGVLNLSVKAWTFLQLVKFKLFKIPLYLE